MKETQWSEQPEKEPKVEIREYSDEYKEQVKDIIYDVYERERGRPRKDRPDLDVIKETYQDNNGNFWMAIENGKVIGTIGTWIDAVAAMKFYERNGWVKIDALPEDIAQHPQLVHDKIFYELDLEQEK